MGFMWVSSPANFSKIQALCSFLNSKVYLISACLTIGFYLQVSVRLLVLQCEHERDETYSFLGSFQRVIHGLLPLCRQLLELDLADVRDEAFENLAHCETSNEAIDWADRFAEEREAFEKGLKILPRRAKCRLSMLMKRKGEDC